MAKRGRNYLSYLLRLWPSDEGASVVWRALLEHPMTGERQGFASLEELFAFLEAQTDSVRRQVFEVDDGESDEQM